MIFSCSLASTWSTIEDPWTYRDGSNQSRVVQIDFIILSSTLRTRSGVKKTVQPVPGRSFDNFPVWVRVMEPAVSLSQRFFRQRLTGWATIDEAALAFKGKMLA